MRAPREFVFKCEHMGGTTWTVEHQWAIEGKAEEVVRCRDCKYNDVVINACDHPQITPLRGDCPENWIFSTAPDGFCAWGKRIVRCKDCVSSYRDEDGMWCCFYGTGFYRKPTDEGNYCSKGKRGAIPPTATETDELPPKWADAPTLDLGA